MNRTGIKQNYCQLIPSHYMTNMKVKMTWADERIDEDVMRYE